MLRKAYAHATDGDLVDEAVNPRRLKQARKPISSKLHQKPLTASTSDYKLQNTTNNSATRTQGRYYSMKLPKRRASKPQRPPWKHTGPRMGAFRAAWSNRDHAAADTLTLHPRSQIGPCAAGWPIQTQREKPWGTGPGSADRRRVNELPFGICTRPSPADFGGRSLAGGSGREGDGGRVSARVRSRGDETETAVWAQGPVWARPTPVQATSPGPCKRDGTLGSVGVGGVGRAEATGISDWVIGEGRRAEGGFYIFIIY